jgi:hypothetical protein
MDLGVPFLMTIFVFGEDLLTEEETFLHVYESSQWQMLLVSFAWSSVGISLRLQYLEQLPVTESMDHALLIVSWQLEMVFTCLLISDHLLFAFSGETVCFFFAFFVPRQMDWYDSGTSVARLC